MIFIKKEEAPEVQIKKGLLLTWGGGKGRKGEEILTKKALET